ncbi:hypothetical protein GGTG_02085 [Gaeumannomyces tritici R3-111a-1]|uniref:Uncharacterized protein n=1 Tax=Gaeumannomyces tritici (strain R3-111a-1) TaxID=644352 RepID=J3NLD7_GAET3|nr:hypothetical protein GGTG_02085 [Gaeumannomyces tritici R3-111a-1]EJT82111.1 hypothetical protein GGTG_02085 [Gaeumannomyces tritici R3-111a-1]
MWCVMRHDEARMLEQRLWTRGQQRRQKGLAPSGSAVVLQAGACGRAADARHPSARRSMSRFRGILTLWVEMRGSQSASSASPNGPPGLLFCQRAAFRPSPTHGVLLAQPTPPRLGLGGLVSRRRRGRGVGLPSLGFAKTITVTANRAGVRRPVSSGHGHPGSPPRARDGAPVVARRERISFQSKASVLGEISPDYARDLLQDAETFVGDRRRRIC